MRSTIAVNGSFFNTQHMLAQYVLNAYFPKSEDIQSEIAAGETNPPAEMAHTGYVSRLKIRNVG